MKKHSNTIFGIIRLDRSVDHFLPNLWIIITAFKTEQGAYSPDLIFVPTLESFGDVFARSNYLSFVLNSIYISLGSTLVCFLFAGGPLFTNARDKSLPTRTIQAVITELARRAKISRVKVSAHNLRHTFALNDLRQNPGKLVDLASLLGHESLDTTAIYTRPSKEELAADLERSRLNVY